MGKTLFLIGTGGFLGSICRYGLQVLCIRYLAPVFPLGTMLVNIAGCLTIGIIYGLTIKGAPADFDARLFLATGFCGGFTTFSTFSYETISLLRAGNMRYAALYVAGSLVLCIGATFGGLWMSGGLLKG